MSIEEAGNSTWDDLASGHEEGDALMLLREYDPGAGSSPDAYAEHCARFAQDELNIKLWSRQLDVVHSFFANRRTAVRSGHAIGKTGLAAVVFEYGFSCLGRCVWSTAPNLKQVRLLWNQVRENREHANRILPGTIVAGGPATPPRLKTGSVSLWAEGFSTNKAEGGQGLHVPGLILIVDEGAGIAPYTWVIVESSMASGGESLLVLGNPTPERNRFWQIFFDDTVRTIWTQHHVTSVETPNFTPAEREYFWKTMLPAFRAGSFDAEKMRDNLPPAEPPVIPGLANMEWVFEQLVQYKEEPWMIDNRVLGEIAESDGESKILPAHFIDAGMKFWLELEEEERDYAEPPPMHCAFLDVAGRGRDRCALVYLKGQRLHVAKWWSEREHKAATMRVADTVNEWICNLPDNDKPEWLGVDANALGVGTHDRLLDLSREHRAKWGRCRVVDMNWSGTVTAKNKQRFVMRIDEVYWALREALNPGSPRHERIGIPPGNSLLLPDPLTKKEVFEQLNARKFVRQRDNRIRTESKSELLLRTGVSPDVGDAMAGCMWKPNITSIRVVG